MKNLHLLIFIIAITIIQKEINGQTNPSNELIVTSGMDTIRNIRILKQKRHTNENYIAFFDHENKKRTLNAEHVKSYYSENRIYFSEMLEDGSFKFINYQAEGYLNFGESFSSIGKKTYYFKKENKVVCLENHANNLTNFLKLYLDDFDSFHMGYNKKILYEFKSLAEFTSAYNVYKFPKKYLFVKYKNKEKSSIGIIANYGFYKIDIDGLSRENQKNISPSLGLDILVRYHRNASLHLPFSFNYTKNTSDLSNIYLTSLNFEPTLEFNIFRKNHFVVSILGGLGVQYHINSYLEQNSGKTKIKGFNAGYQIGILTMPTKRTVLTFAYFYNNLSTEALDPQSLENTWAKGNMRGLKIGLDFYLN